MDLVTIGAALIGFGVGWVCKSLKPDPVVPTACACDCHCIHQSSDTGSSLGHSGVILTM